MYAGFGKTLTLITPPGMATGATGGVSAGAATGAAVIGTAGRAAPPPHAAITNNVDRMSEDTAEP
jgi:hypothetical protein